MAKNEPRFRITDHKGFQLSFKNGLTISVQFGGGNYCSNKKIPIGSERHNSNLVCLNAEIAIFPSSDQGWLTNRFLPKKRGTDVVGWVEPDEVASLIRRVQRSKIKA